MFSMALRSPSFCSPHAATSHRGVLRPYGGFDRSTAGRIDNSVSLVAFETLAPFGCSLLAVSDRFLGIEGGDGLISGTSFVAYVVAMVWYLHFRVLCLGVAR